jgi:hypothetical protein
VEYQEKEELRKKPPAVGDVFYTGWGYDQTQYDFIIIIGISPTGKSVICQRAKVMQDPERKNEQTIDFVQPKTEGYGKPFRMLVDHYSGDFRNGQYGLKGSYPYCDNDDHAKRFDHFSKVCPGDVFGETAAGYGH